MFHLAISKNSIENTAAFVRDLNAEPPELSAEPPEISAEPPEISAEPPQHSEEPPDDVLFLEK